MMGDSTVLPYASCCWYGEGQGYSLFGGLYIIRLWVCHGTGGPAGGFVFCRNCHCFDLCRNNDDHDDAFNLSLNEKAIPILLCLRIGSQGHHFLLFRCIAIFVHV
ncbi:hypothetical protein BS78_07G123000 [Paspalum vaginatum]|nr:hypothetical protein BS78_07G123000 [Paspalum vaginatum]